MITSFILSENNAYENSPSEKDAPQIWFYILKYMSLYYCVK